MIPGGQVRLLAHAGRGMARSLTVHGHGRGWDNKKLVGASLPLVRETPHSVFVTSVTRNPDGSATIRYSTD